MELLLPGIGVRKWIKSDALERLSRRTKRRPTRRFWWQCGYLTMPLVHKEIAIRVLSHTYVVDRIFAANMTGAEHEYTSANTSRARRLWRNCPRRSRPTIIGTSITYRASIKHSWPRASTLPFTDGEPGHMSREEMLMHVTLHGESHRGEQVGWMMMQNSITPPADRFTRLSAQGRSFNPAPGSRRPNAASPKASSPRAGPTRSQPATHHADETAAKEGKARSPLDELTESMRAAVRAPIPISAKTVKFDLKGKGFIHIDGGLVTSSENKPADLTLTCHHRGSQGHRPGHARPNDRDGERTARPPTWTSPWALKAKCRRCS